MPYKVFLVEDEIVTREGIRDNVDWKSAGFYFCGEAPDGEIALPLIEKAEPDLLITDIKMPFMDGIQLCKIIRKQMPWIKIIILSGHDEFEFAQSAVKLGVLEYLLKPISAVEIQRVLENVAEILDQEREENARLRELQSQVKDIEAMRRERLLLELVVGGMSSSTAIEEYGRLGLNMIAEYYLVILIKVDPYQNNGHFDPAKYQAIHDIVIELTGSYPGALYAQKSVEEFLLIMMGDDPKQLKHDGQFLAGLIKGDVQKALDCDVSFGVGSIQQRLTQIHASFADALASITNYDKTQSVDPKLLLDNLTKASKLDQAAIEHYLKTGLIADFDSFFDVHLRQVSEVALYSNLIKHYLIVDIILTCAQFVTDLGGETVDLVPSITDVDRLLVELNSIDQIQETIRHLLADVLVFRNAQTQNGKLEFIFRAKAFIEAHFSDPNLYLDDVAMSVNLSPSHFSMVFGRETGESFKAYLTRIRIEHAKELLLTTNLKCSEIAFQCGYSDPHYFSYAFKRSTGMPPQQFRQSITLE